MNSDLERIMELHRHEHFATWNEAELAEYESLKSKLTSQLEDAEKLQLWKDEIKRCFGDIEFKKLINKALSEASLEYRIKNLKEEISISESILKRDATEIKKLEQTIYKQNMSTLELKQKVEKIESLIDSKSDQYSFLIARIRDILKEKS